MQANKGEEDLDRCVKMMQKRLEYFDLMQNLLSTMELWIHIADSI